MSSVDPSPVQALHRCRRCRHLLYGATLRDDVAWDLLPGLLSGEAGSRLIPLLDRHRCWDGLIGVAELIGFGGLP